MRQCDFSLMRLYVGETIPVNSAAFAVSADGRRILWNDLHTVYSWNAETGETADRVSGFGSILSISRDGRRIVSKTYTGEEETDFVLRTFDLESRQLVTQFNGHKSQTLLAIFDDTGTRIASGAEDGTASVWDAQSGKGFGTMPSAGEPIQHLAISRGGSRIAAAGGKRAVWVWDVGSAHARRLEASGRVTAMALSPDGSRVIAAGDDARMRIWNAQTGELLADVESEDGHVLSVAVSPDVTKIFSGLVGGAVEVRDLATGVVVGFMLGHAVNGGAGVRHIGFTPDGSRVLTHDLSTVRVWDASSYSSKKLLSGDDEMSFGVRPAIIPRDHLVIAGGRSLRWLDTRSGAEVAKYSGAVSHIALSPDSSRVAAGLYSGEIQLYDAQSQAPLLTLRGDHHHLGGLVFSTDGKLVFSASEKTVRVWRVDSRSIVNSIGMDDLVSCIALSPDGRRLAVGTATGQPTGPRSARGPSVRVFDATTLRSLLAIDTRVALAADMSPVDSRPLWDFRSVTSVEFSPGGERLLVAENVPPNVTLWDTRSGTYLGSRRSLTRAVFLPEGNRILGLARDHLVVMDAKSGEQLLSFRDVSDPLATLAVSADGGFLAEQTMRGSVRIWDVSSTHEPETWGYVHSLYLLLGFVDRVIAAIKSDASLRSDVREAALRLAGQLRDDYPGAHDRASFMLARKPGLPASDYREALRHSEAACQLAPWNPTYWNTLGIARYRAGLYADALKSLAEARRIRGSAAVSNLAFTAMAQYSLGRLEEAQATARELRSRILREKEDPARVEGNWEELMVLVREVESLGLRGSNDSRP
jgi:WD40 repeat protein